MKAPSFWYQPPGLAAKALEPLANIWRAASVFRRGLSTPYRSNKPVICIGNIVAGGAGKTPAAFAIAQMLKDGEQNPVFVTRGYGGKERGPLRVDPATHTVSDVGDEALLLARKAPTWIGRDRAAAIRAAEPHGSHIVLDDGLQNPHIKPDFSFLVIDGESGLGNGLVIPAGPLRETLEEVLPRVTAAILVGLNDRQNIAARISCPVLHAELKPVLSDGFPQRDKFFAFAGIGRPSKFYATCRVAGLTLAGAWDFPDHHIFSSDDIARLRDAARKQDARLVTTEKDWVRLPPVLKNEVLALPVTLVFKEPAAVMQLLNAQKPV